MANPHQKSLTNRTLASNVSAILRRPGLLEIAFTLGRIKVTGAMLFQVAQAVDSGRIKCWTANEFKSRGRGETVGNSLIEAKYRSKPNAMVFLRENYGSTPSEEQTIVHESVHAALDLSTSGKLTTLSVDDEAAATLASAFYIILCKRAVGGFALGGGGHAEALELAEQALKFPGNFAVKDGMFYFTEFDVASLKQAVAASRGFNKFIGDDGLPTDNSAAVYIYEGVALCGKTGCH